MFKKITFFIKWLFFWQTFLSHILKPFSHLKRYTEGPVLVLIYAELSPSVVSPVFVEGIDWRHFLFSQIEVKYIDIWYDSLFCRTLGDHHNSPLGLPFDTNSCRTDSIFLSQVFDQSYVQRRCRVFLLSCSSSGQRWVCRQYYTSLSTPLQQFFLAQVWVTLDLIDCRHCRRVLNQVLDLLRIKVWDTDRTGQTSKDRQIFS